VFGVAQFSGGSCDAAGDLAVASASESQQPARAALQGRVSHQTWSIQRPGLNDQLGHTTHAIEPAKSWSNTGQIVLDPLSDLLTPRGGRGASGRRWVWRFWSSTGRN
jgi:hypothetical protein